MAGLPGATHSRARIMRPAVRKGFLERGAASKASRGQEQFIEVDWETALTLAAKELDRVRNDHGNDAIFGGSYGWASAGRFHHAQSQIHRFLNCIGGYTRSEGNYSYAAGLVTTPHIVGPCRALLRDSTVWPVVEQHGDLVVMFGGAPLRNMDVATGGIGRHTTRQMMQACRDTGTAFVNIGPSQNDLTTDLDASWLSIRPNTDTALMLGLCHTLLTENLHDAAFLATYTVGFDTFKAYLTGATDGTPKTAEWAAHICDCSAETIRTLARQMAVGRTLVTLAAGIQRGDHGEQPIWAVITLAAMLGQIGLPAGGFGLFYGADSIIGAPIYYHQWPKVEHGHNPVDTYIPVARIADLLLNPGQSYPFDGQTLTYPDIKLVYWAGGNPFHHHQDLNRLVRAFQQPDCVIVNEIWWTGTARHADIVFPSTTMLERNDICINRHDYMITAMHKAIDPVGESRPDFEIFRGLAEKLGAADAFTAGRDETEWLHHLWQHTITRGASYGFTLPDFDTFWENGVAELPPPAPTNVMLAAFRADPINNPLPTPSGKIEIFSETVAGFGYADCPGYAAWLEPYEWLGNATDYPLHLISSQPPVRLHSQLDSGPVSRKRKIAGREPVTLHPIDAAARGLVAGDVVRIFNARGACLAGVTISDDLRPGVIRLCTGAWYDPIEPGVTGALDKHGNPNVLTRDKGTSSLAQGPSAHTTLVEVEKFEGELPPITAFEAPI